MPSLTWLRAAGPALGLMFALASCDEGAPATAEVQAAARVPNSSPADRLAGSSCPTRPVAGFLVADAEGQAIRSYDGAGTFHFAFGHEALEEPFDVTWGPGHDLYVADFSTSEVHRFDGHSLAHRGVAYLDRHVLEEPMVLRATHDAVVTLGNDTSNVVVSTALGSLRVAFGDPTLQWPVAMALDAQRGRVYVGRSGTAGHRVEHYDISGGPRRGEFGDGLGLGPVRGLAVGCPDALYATADDALLKFRLEPMGGATLVEHWTLQDAGRLRTGPDGRPYVLAGDLLLRLSPDDVLEPVVAFAESVEARGFEFAQPPLQAEFRG